MTEDLQYAVRLRNDGRLSEARTTLERHLRRTPGDADAAHFLGMIASQQGDLQGARKWMLRSTELAPRNPIFRINLAAVLGNLKKPHEALEQLKVGVSLPGGDRPELHNNIGVAHERLGELKQAAEALKRAIALKPDYAEAYAHLGNVCRKASRFDEAARSYERALGLNPDSAGVLEALAACHAELGDAAASLRCYRRLVELDPRHAGHRSAMLYTLHYDPAVSAESLYEEHRRWDALHGNESAKARRHPNDRSTTRRLKVGYISPDFKEHTPPRFITGAFAHHDPDNFELFVYSDVDKPDEVTAFLRGTVENWRDVLGMGDEKVDELIARDGIDILVDVRGHAASNRMTLFARKPAPVQATMIAYFNTTGLSTIDYRITDAVQDPPGHSDSLHAEKLVRLGGGCWCYWPDPDAPDVAEAPALTNGHVTFGTLNKLVKVSEPCARAWASLLEAVPGSRLLLTAAGAERQSEARTSILRRLAAAGLDPTRVQLVGKVGSRADYLRRYGEIDVALDTYPFNGITTTCDALWMGVPTVTWSGHTGVSRSTRSILTSAGLAHLAADTPGEFVRAAASLAADPQALGQLRRTMRQRLLAAPLLDHRRFARGLESAYLRMWRAWATGGASQPLDV
jgi:predicted O-linked N-acetylglucosamine transferase (SPINDLY family)